MACKCREHSLGGCLAYFSTFGRFPYSSLLFGFRPYGGRRADFLRFAAFCGHGVPIEKECSTKAKEISRHCFSRNCECYRDGERLSDLSLENWVTIVRFPPQNPADRRSLAPSPEPDVPSSDNLFSYMTGPHHPARRSLPSSTSPRHLSPVAVTANASISAGFRAVRQGDTVSPLSP